PEAPGAPGLAGPEPLLERRATAARDPVQRLVRPGRLRDLAAPCKAELDETGKHRVEAAPRRRPDVADRLLREVEEVIAGALAFDREEREHGGLGGRDRLRLGLG